MKLTALFLVLAALLSFRADVDTNLYKTSKATIEFSSEAPMEIIKAKSDKLKGVLDIEKNKYAFQVSVITFEGFNSDLQREHFNENYMESTKFPKIKFVGSILTPIDYKTNFTKDVKLKGELSIHGVTKPVEITAKMTKNGDSIFSESEFSVKLADYNISIPTIVNQKLAKVINIKVKTELVPRI
jgi:polyisoprenoid-binding protein YceI